MGTLNEHLKHVFKLLGKKIFKILHLIFFVYLDLCHFNYDICLFTELIWLDIYVLYCLEEWNIYKSKYIGQVKQKLFA